MQSGISNPQPEPEKGDQSELLGAFITPPPLSGRAVEVLRERLQDFQIIDFEASGESCTTFPNRIVLNLAPKDLKSWWGDDWNDRPYEHNAGGVYSEFTNASLVIAPDEGLEIFEPCNGSTNSFFSKEDMIKRAVPCLVVVRPESGYYYDFTRAIGDEKSDKIYFGDSAATLLDIPGIEISHVRFHEKERILLTGGGETRDFFKESHFMRSLDNNGVYTVHGVDVVDGERKLVKKRFAPTGKVDELGRQVYEHVCTESKS